MTTGRINQVTSSSFILFAFRPPFAVPAAYFAGSRVATLTSGLDNRSLAAFFRSTVVVPLVATATASQNLDFAT